MSDPVDNPIPDADPELDTTGDVPPLSEAQLTAMAIAAVEDELLRDDLKDLQQYAEMGVAPGRSSCKRVVAALLAAQAK
jgi:hypothetical protein